MLKPLESSHDVWPQPVDPSTLTAPLIRIRGFSKRYRGQTAVADVSLDIRRGEIYGLIGPDGAGKSSLMKAVAGVLTFNGGEIEVFGVRLDSEAACERIKDRIGFMPQGLGLNLYPELSVEENIDFFARLRLVPENELLERKQKLLAMTRLEAFRARPMKNLSGGMKQKLGLVCTLIHEPELIILDEPTTGVDPVSRRDFWNILAQLIQEKGITALVSTAYLDEAARFHHISLVFDGKVLAQGEPQEIAHLAPGRIVALHSTRQLETLERLREHFPQVESLGSWIRSFVDEIDDAAAISRIKGVLGALPVDDIHVSEPELEDVFITLLRQPPATQPQSPEDTPPAPTLQWAHNAQQGVATQGHHHAIEALDLSKDFGAFRAVEQVSFRVPQGEIFGLLGANGAGKTTVIKMLTGILRPNRGTGRVAGVDMRRAGQRIKGRIGYMSQAFSLYLDLTVMENINLYAGIYGLSGNEKRQRTAWVVKMAGLSSHETDRASSLPIGLRQRLALGCALVHRPQVLFLDEPTSGVDPLGRRRFWDILFKLSREDGVAILITTHYMSEAEHCDHLALMYAGRIVADASPAEMKRQVESEAGRLLEISVAEPRRAVQELAQNGITETALFGKRIHILSREPEADKQRIVRILSTANIRLDAIMPRPLSMEDVFVYRITALEQQERHAAGAEA